MVTTTTLFEQSLEIANDILMESDNLSNTDVKAEMYQERIPYLTDLLGEEGKVSFHPFVSKDITKEFHDAMENDLYIKQRAYYDCIGDDRVYGEAYYLAGRLKEFMTDENLVSNTVPQSLVQYIESQGIKGYNSPKLSKVLVKLFGEHSDVVKWFTNSCPKNLDKGLNTDYKVHLSILPHHIAGMSYYAPYNFEGARWTTGWNGTSCMDTKRNSTGGGIYQLPPSLLDSTLAIAYLTTSDNDDDSEPRYLARTLVRVAKVNDNDYVMLGARTFFTSNELKHILLDGLKSEFENFIYTEDLRKGYNVNNNKPFFTPTEIGWEVESAKETCDDCDGDEDGCSTCDYDGYTLKSETYYPYIDDTDFVNVADDGVHMKLPTKWLEEMGYIEKEVSPTPIFNNLVYAC